MTAHLQQISQEQDWGDPIDKELAEIAKHLWHANIAKDKLKNYVENDKIRSNCTFLLVPKMNSKIFCQITSQAKGHDVKLQKLLSMTSLKLIKTPDNLIVIKESENLDSIRMTRMKRHAIETLTIFSRANGSITQTRRDHTVSYLSRDYKQLRSGVPESSEYLFGDDLYQRVQATTKSSKTTKKISRLTLTQITGTTKDPFLRLTTPQIIS